MLCSRRFFDRTADQESDAICFQNSTDSIGYVLVLSASNPICPLDNCHLSPKAGIHLSELQTDVTCAGDHKVIGNCVEFHHGRIREVGHIGKSRPIRGHSGGARIDEYPTGPQHALPYADLR